MTNEEPSAIEKLTKRKLAFTLHQYAEQRGITLEQARADVRAYLESIEVKPVNEDDDTPTRPYAN